VNNRPTSAMSALMLATNFVSGASIMIVEIAGARLIAPVVGNSIYTWSALIGVVLVALAAGGWLGGFLADRRDGHGTLSILLALGAASILLISPLSAITTSSVSSMGLITGPMVISIVLFTLPALLQGAISPLATRIISRDHRDKRIGLSAGLVNASGALGSFFGTLGAGFYLVPNYSLQDIFSGAAYVLVFISAICAFVYMFRTPKVSVVGLSSTIVALVLSMALHYGIVFQYSDNVRLVRQSPYHQIRVTDTKDDDGRVVRQLVHDRTAQGFMYLDTDELPRKYQRTWKLSELYLPQGIQSSLFVGGGSFSIPKALHIEHPEASVTVVEIDPAVVRTGREWFRLTDYPAIDVIVSDARRYLSANTDRYDFIYLDAYNGLRQIPAHLVTQEFFSGVRDHLSLDGIVMINLIGNVEEPHNGVFDSVYATLMTVFEQVYVYVSSDEKRRGGGVVNLTIVAGAAMFDPDMTKYESESEFADITSGFVDKKSYSHRRAPILTDSLNPIDSLIAQSLQYRSTR